MQESVGISKTKQVKALWRLLTFDPRHYQICVLTSLIIIGMTVFDFGLPLWHVVGCISGALLTQFISDKSVGRAFEPRSALITALSLTLLLRTGSLWMSLLAGAIAIGSKSVFRLNGKHIFNPANFALVVLALSFASIWVSPGQWGTAGWLAILLIALGGIVTGKAKRWDVSLAFLGFYAVLIIGRALWLGDPLSIPAHQLQSGALLIFTFFMISDPKTTPNARAGRVAYAAIVAAIGFTIQFLFFEPVGIIYALVLAAPCVPLIDLFFKDGLYQWPQLSAVTRPISNSVSQKFSSSSTQTGEFHDEVNHQTA